MHACRCVPTVARAHPPLRAYCWMPAVVYLPFGACRFASNEQVSQIIGQIRPDRQTLLFSATLSERLEEACGGGWLRQPLRVYAEEVVGGEGGEGGEDGEGSNEGGEEAARAAEDEEKRGAAAGEALSAVPSSVEQRFIMCGQGGRSVELLGLLHELGHSIKGGGAHEELGVDGGGDGGGTRGRRGPAMRNAPRVMVFINEISTIRDLSTRLRKRGVRCESLHGERPQREREESMQRFKAGAAPILLTSDLASRGLDVTRLPVIVNFDPPQSAASYVHRAGRTGRQGAAGLVVSLVRHDAPSKHLAAQLRGLFKRAAQPLPPALCELLGNDAAGGAALADEESAEAEGSAALPSQRAAKGPARAAPPMASLLTGGSLLDFAAAVANGSA